MIMSSTQHHFTCVYHYVLHLIYHCDTIRSHDAFISPPRACVSSTCSATRPDASLSVAASHNESEPGPARRPFIFPIPDANLALSFRDGLHRRVHCSSEFRKIAVLLHRNEGCNSWLLFIENADEG